MTRLWFDVGTIITWDRPSNGVVRCEAEYAAYLLTCKPVAFVFCTFVGGCLEVIPEQRVALALKNILDLCQDIPAKMGITDTTMGEPKRIAAQDVYFSIGADWLKGPLIHLYEKKKQVGFKVMLCCYDTIPIFYSALTLGWLADLFPLYLSSVAWSADAIICISTTTEADLKYFLSLIGSPIPKTYVVSLGCEIRKLPAIGSAAMFSAAVNRPYILFVSTIEIRKNHRILYLAYRQLLSQGIQDLPLLLLVGSPGWGVEELLDEIDNDKELKKYFLFMPNVTDTELSDLYRGALFTVYPSFYEGWGLPVAESLAFGKFCLASTAPSLREVGKDWIEYLDPHDEQIWAQKILWFYRHPETVLEREKQIENEFTPLPWSKTCREMTIFTLTLLAK